MSVCPCLPSPVCLPRGFPPSNTGTSWLLAEVALLVMRKQWNCFRPPYFSLFTCVNVRLTLCACIVKNIQLVQLWKCLHACKQPSICNVKIQHSPQQTCYSVFSGSDQMAFCQKLIWQPFFNMCCLECVDCLLLVFCVMLRYSCSHCELFDSRVSPKSVSWSFFFFFF